MFRLYVRHDVEDFDHWFSGYSENADLINRHSPYTIQIRGNRTTFPPPRELYPLCSHPMA